MRARIRLRAMLQEVAKRVAPAGAGLFVPRQVVDWLEPSIRLAALRCSVQQVMRERMHARRADVRITLQIKCGVEVFLAEEEPAYGSLESPHLEPDLLQNGDVLRMH